MPIDPRHVGRRYGPFRNTVCADQIRAFAVAVSGGVPGHITNRILLESMAIQNATDKAEIIAEIMVAESKIDSIASLVSTTQNNTAVRFIVPERLIKPVSGTKSYQYHLRLYDAAGNPLYLICTTTDITERKRAEESVRVSRDQLNEAQRLAMLGSWTLDLRDHHLVWSDEIFRIFEIDPMRFGASYEAFLDTVHPDDRDRVNRAYTECSKAACSEGGRC